LEAANCAEADGNHKSNGKSQQKRKRPKKGLTPERIVKSQPDAGATSRGFRKSQLKVGL
jgi:hypothetical protein